MRLRLKADGRIVEITADGRERDLPSAPDLQRAAAGLAPAVDGTQAGRNNVADYSRGLRGRSRLTQAEFAARIGVPIETVRNWEQGKRSPRGPARALLKVIEKAPDLVFAALADEA